VTPDEARETTGMWAEMLAGIDFQTAVLALKMHIATNKYPPAISEILENATSAGGYPDVDEAWGEVTAAIRRHGLYNAKAALESLSPLTRTVAGLIGWQQLCMSENQMADRAHFMRLYETAATRERRNRQIPASVKMAIADASAKLRI